MWLISVYAYSFYCCSSFLLLFFLFILFFRGSTEWLLVSGRGKATWDLFGSLELWIVRTGY